MYSCRLRPVLLVTNRRTDFTLCSCARALANYFQTRRAETKMILPRASLQRGWHHHRVVQLRRGGQFLPSSLRRVEADRPANIRNEVRVLHHEGAGAWGRGSDW